MNLRNEIAGEQKLFLSFARKIFIVWLTDLPIQRPKTQLSVIKSGQRFSFMEVLPPDFMLRKLVDRNSSYPMLNWFAFVLGDFLGR